MRFLQISIVGFGKTLPIIKKISFHFSQWRHVYSSFCLSPWWGHKRTVSTIIFINYILSFANSSHISGLVEGFRCQWVATLSCLMTPFLWLKVNLHAIRWRSVGMVVWRNVYVPDVWCLRWRNARFSLPAIRPFSRKWVPDVGDKVWCWKELATRAYNSVA